MRRLILGTIAKAQSIPEILHWCLGYPDDLPNLFLEKVPKSNTRPEGIRESHYERKQRDELPEYY